MKQQMEIPVRDMIQVYDDLMPDWTPFEKTDKVKFPDAVIALADDGYEEKEIYVNSRYVVLKYPMGTNDFFGEGFWLSIHDHDKTARHDWRDFQKIKNEICGEDWEAIEIYPAEDRHCDLSNQYHLWCFSNKPFQQLGIGLNRRLIANENVIPNTRQRPFAPHHRPDDLEDMSEELKDRVLHALRKQAKK